MQEVIFEFDDFSLNTHPLELRLNGQPVDMRISELRLLHQLVRHAGTAVSVTDLQVAVCPHGMVAHNALPRALERLRKALGHDPQGGKFLKHIRGFGYVFVRPVRTVAASPSDLRVETPHSRHGTDPLEFSSELLCGISSRLQCDAPDVHKALTAAAVIGTEFTLQLVAAIVDDPLETVRDRLNRACARGILKTKPGENETFEFEHEVWARALCAALEPTAKLDIYNRVALALVGLNLTDTRIASQDFEHNCNPSIPCIPRHGRFQQDVVTPRASTHSKDAERELLYSDRGADAPRPRSETGQLQDATSLARAALMLDPLPGFVPAPGARAAMCEALERLPTSEPELRAALMAALAVRAPLAFDDQASALQLATARTVSKAESLLARSTLDSVQLYRFAGLDATEKLRANVLMNGLSRLALRGQRQAGTLRPWIQLHRAIVCRQVGDTSGACAAIRSAREAARNIDAPALVWQLERCQSVLDLERGFASRAKRTLKSLHACAHKEHLASVALLSEYDRVVLLGESSREFEVFEHDGDDTPSVWAMKIRALTACGRCDKAYTALRLVSPHALKKLSRDRDYVGTLGSLARSALELNASEYIDVLLCLLAPYRDLYAVTFAFNCEGSVAQLLGMLAEAQGYISLARTMLKHGASKTLEAGLVPLAMAARRHLSALRSLEQR